MGTKNNPGRYDCYEKAHPDEPMFILLGRDPIGAAAVRLWAEAREAIKPSDPKVLEAVECATAMDVWCRERADREPCGKLLGLLTFDDLADELRRRGATVTPEWRAKDSEINRLRGEIKITLAAERERCAKVCKTLALEADGDIGFRDGCHECADGIRGPN